MLRLHYSIYFTALFASLAFTDKFGSLFEIEDSQLFTDASNAPISQDSKTFHDTEIENQLPDDTALLFANDQIDSANLVNVAPLAGWSVGDGPIISTQGDDSIDGWDSIPPAGTFLNIADPSSDPSTSPGLVDTGYATATSPTDYLSDPLKYFDIPLPDVMIIFQEKCPPVRDGEKLVPLCCTGGRNGQTVTECRPYDLTNWNCYLRHYQYCCKLFITESLVGVSCLKGFA